MTSIQEIGEKMVYPGRFLIVGHTPEHLFHFYGVTARSASSRAKYYVYQPTSGKIVVVPTNAELMAQGDLSLLDYTAACLAQDLIIVGNGRQTDRVQKRSETTAQNVLRTSLAEEASEDDRYHTPRISGCSLQIDNQWTQALHIIRRNDQGLDVRECYEVPAHTPCALFISTYAGPNIRPTPSFVGDPYAITLPKGSIEEQAREIYNAFTPQKGAEDLRVSLVAVMTEKTTGGSTVFIINAAENGDT